MGAILLYIWAKVVGLGVPVGTPTTAFIALVGVPTDEDV